MIPLTEREREVADLIVEGADVEEIAASLGLGVWGVKKHVRMIRAKVGARSMREIPQALAKLPPTE